MAKFSPEIEYIEKEVRPTPQPGELWLVKELIKLNNDYEVYFQPFLNGDHPDVIVLKKGCGAYIIEVKDYHLDSYGYVQDNRSKYGGLSVLNEPNGTVLMTPMEQVMRYKDNLFTLHSIKMKDAIFDNRSIYGRIKTAVLFYGSKEQVVHQKFRAYNNEYMGMWGDDTNICKEIEKALKYPNPLFTDELYQDMKLLFMPSEHLMSQNKVPNLVGKQRQLSTSSPNKQAKIKGVAGSGKTLVLAKRAINAYERTNRPVLILTFNITLRNYIADKISQFRTGINKEAFYIIHFHGFLQQQCTEYGILDDSRLDDESKDQTRKTVALLKKEIKNKQVNKFGTILIDEVQDFEYEWLELVKECFLEKGGEYVLFGDEKQNIYDRALDIERKIHTNVKGQWTKLDQSYRIKKEIAVLANHFQKDFLSGKYELDEIQFVQQDLFSKEDIIYYDCVGKEIREIYSLIQDYRKKNSIVYNDLCILGGRVENLRKLEYYLRTEQHIQCKTMFEKEEQYQELLDKDLPKDKMQMELSSLRRTRKFNFWMNSGEMKLSTIHSFKGWEAHTLVIILDDAEDIKNEELIYTAITRCKTNLIIISMIENKYETFFKKYIEKCECVNKGV